MKRIFLSVVLCILTFSWVAAFNPERYTLNVGDFSELEIVDNISVIHRCNADSAGMAVFTATSDVVPCLIFTNKKEKLKIEWNIDMNVPVTESPVITVYSKIIVSVENCGDNTVYVENPSPGALFKARVVGNGTIAVKNIYTTQTEASLDTGKGNIILEGTTRVSKFKNIGKGVINALNLQSDDCTVTLLGTGKIECFANRELTIKGMGSGSVYVKGNPAIKKRAIGSIDVIKTEEQKP